VTDRPALDDLAAHGHNPHLRAPARDGCPHGACDGSGFVLDEEANEARPCRCRAARIAHARTRSLARTIPKRFEHVGFDRYPVTEMDTTLVRSLRRFCRSIEARLDEGRGLLFFGTKGTGKTTLAMLVAQEAMRHNRTVAVYTAPDLLGHFHATYRGDSTDSELQLMERLAAVDLLVLDDIAVARQNDWVLERFYAVVNRRYEDERSIIVTAEVESPAALSEHIGARTASRLIQICDGVPMFGTDHRTGSE
jgi:DNA replication protein DnaC